MVQLKITDRIRDTIKSAIEQCKVDKDENTLKQLQQCLSSDAIQYKLLEKAVDKINGNIHQTIKGSSLYFPPKKEEKKDPKYLARLAKLRKEYEDKLYSQMVANVVPKKVCIP